MEKDLESVEFVVGETYVVCGKKQVLICIFRHVDDRHHGVYYGFASEDPNACRIQVNYPWKYIAGNTEVKCSWHRAIEITDNDSLHAQERIIRKQIWQRKN
jgi:hypothetical protein